MFTKLLNLWYTIRSSFWFVPTLMVAGVIVLSYVTLFIDEIVRHPGPRDVESIYSGGPEGARTVLATIAGSMIGVTGVVFSITIVTLTLASAQFGPRLLRNFMRDVGNQIVLGTFIATFVCGVIHIDSTLLQSGSRAGLLPPSPLRTARTSFPVSRSSLSNALWRTR